MFTENRNTSPRISRAILESSRAKETRRSFLAKSAAWLAAIYGSGTFQPGLRAATGNDPGAIRIPSPTRSVIFLNMAGGMSHLDTLDPKGHPDVRGPFGSVESSIKGVRISERLPLTAKELHRANLVRSVFSKQGDHARGQHVLHSGHDFANAFLDIPCLGSVIAFAKSQRSKTYFPEHVTIGGRGGLVGRAGFLGSTYDSFHVAQAERPLQNIKNPQRLPPERLARREQMLDLLNTEFGSTVSGSELTAWQEMHSAAVDFMNSSKLDVFDIAREDAALMARFGNSATGKAFLLALRLARAGLPFIEVTVGGFDTHANNKARMETILRDLDPALAALLGELGSSGLFKNTLLFLGSEFGRTPVLSANGDGRDHYPSTWTVLMAGGPLSQGQVYGASDEKGQKPARDPVHLKDVVATIYKASGIDPDGTLKNSMGRPFPIVPESHPVEALFA